nr:hypothetical protein [Tanacetum cinerariifolium]GFA93194.1 hypothetical protein [Tanacetum cinerariifolium]
VLPPFWTYAWFELDCPQDQLSDSWDGPYGLYSWCLFVAGKGGRGSWGSCGGSGMEGKTGEKVGKWLAGNSGRREQYLLTGKITLL